MKDFKQDNSIKKTQVPIESRNAWHISLLRGIVITILIGIFLRIFFIEIYMIPSLSMEPTILSGDFIMVSKMAYGPRVSIPEKFFKENKTGYLRIKGWNKIKLGDKIVFNFPNYSVSLDSTYKIWGRCIVKRCYGLPGDTVLIKNEKSGNGNILGKDATDTLQKYNVFPYDSNLKWTIDDYGPLYVPASGDEVQLTKSTIKMYKDILRFENPNCTITDSTIVIDGGPLSRYTFNYDYYFMLGDNFYNSNDSRYWGFLPDSNIIGKVVMILFSVDKNKYGFRKFRLNRLFKIV